MQRPELMIGAPGSLQLNIFRTLSKQRRRSIWSDPWGQRISARMECFPCTVSVFQRCVWNNLKEWFQCDIYIFCEVNDPDQCKGAGALWKCTSFLWILRRLEWVHLEVYERKLFSDSVSPVWAGWRRKNGWYSFKTSFKELVRYENARKT